MEKTTPNEQLNIGARILLHEQAEKLLTGYATIDTQILEFRKQAEQYRLLTEQYRKQAGQHKHHMDKKVHAEFDKQFTNTISILGDRGSGKTSVLLTLKHSYQTEKHNVSDIVLPLIVPDQISAPNNTLGWILSFLNEELIKLDAEKKERDLRGRSIHRTFEHCIKENRSDLQQLFDSVYKKYLFRSEEYHNLIQRRDEGITEFKKDNLDVIDADHQLIQSFRKFIEVLLEEKRKIYPSEQEPLLFIFFDDVDISAHRCQEVLDTIRVYLSHPNVIVFVSGDYLEFSEAMTLDFLRKDKIENMDFNESFISTTISERMQLGESGIKTYKREINALGIRKERSQEYLKKVFPPAFRFKMRPLTHQEKAKFFYETMDGNTYTNKKTLKYLLSRIKFSREHAMHDRGRISFDGLEDVYFRAFDKNPRGLINPYYFLYRKQNETWDLHDVERLFTIMVGSTQLLTEYESDIRNFIMFDSGLVDYKRLDIFFERLITYRSKVEESYPLEHLVTLFSTAVLFDHLFNRYHLSFGRVQEHKHGEILLRYLNYNSKGTYPKENNTAKLIALYDKLSAIIPTDEMNNLFKDTEGRNLQLLLEKRYFEELTEFYKNQIPLKERPFISDEEEGIVQLFEYMALHDVQWLNMKLEFILSSGRNFQDIFNVTIRETYDELLSYLGHFIPGRIAEFRNISNTDDVKEQINQYVNKWVSSSNVRSVSATENWATLYGKLYKFIISCLENAEKNINFSIENINDESSLETANKDVEKAIIQEKKLERDRIMNKIYYYRAKPEFHPDIELVENEQELTNAFVALEKGSIAKQLERIMSAELLALEEKFKNCLQIVEITLNSYKSRLTMTNSEVKITNDITRALDEIIDLRLSSTIDLLCRNLSNENKVEYNSYKNIINDIREKVYTAIESRKLTIRARTLAQRSIEYLVSTTEGSTDNIDKSNDFDKRFFQHIYLIVCEDLFLLYVNLKAYVRYIETEDNEAIKYFRQMKSDIMNYYQNNQYQNRTAFIKLLEILLERESQ